MTPMPGKIPIDDAQDWAGEISKSRQARQQLESWWEANLDRYAPDQTTDPVTYNDAVNTNRDFTLVERKKADLFYQRPDIVALASPLLVGHEAYLDTHTKILNQQLGLNGVQAEALCDAVLFDILCPSGMGWTAMGYESATVSVPDPTPDPMTGQPAVDPETGQPAMVPVPVYENVFWRHFSPKQGLTPASARSVKADDWPWIGMDFEMPLRSAKHKGWVPEDFAGSAASAELRFEHGLPHTAGETVVRGQLVYYKSSLYRDDRPHPLHQTMLILIDGVEEPAEHKDSPYQTLDAQGRLTPDSLIGFPIHPGTIRLLTDSASVPSDCTISAPLVMELNKFREQMTEQRANTLLKYQYNVDTLPPDALAKIVRSPIGGFIGVPGEAFVGDGAIKEIPHGTYPRENFTMNDYIDNDLARTHAIDAEQSGAGSPGEQSATESQIKQNNVNARLGKERTTFLNWYLAGVTKYSSILQRLLPVEDAAKIVGPQKAQEWDSWRKQVPASLAFSVVPDSSLRTDIAADRDRRMKEYTFFANDPFVNRVELVKQLMPRLGYSPSVINAQPPKKQPEPTKPTFAFTGEDLNPQHPQFAIVMEILRQTGIEVSPQAVQQAAQGAQAIAEMAPFTPQDTGRGTPAAPTGHGGKVAPMEGLSKHAADLTGGMQGSGASIAGAGAGGVQ